MGAGERLAEIEERIKTEIAAHLWKTEPLFKERAKLRAELGVSDERT